MYVNAYFILVTKKSSDTPRTFLRNNWSVLLLSLLFDKWKEERWVCEASILSEFPAQLQQIVLPEILESQRYHHFKWYLVHLVLNGQSEEPQKVRLTQIRP
jgi:hypothetical protein